MKKILLLTILTALFSCSSKEDIQLKDGFYLESSEDNSVRIHLSKAPEDCCYCYLSPKPFIEISDMKSLEVSADSEHPECVELFFNLIDEGKSIYNEIIKSNYHENVYFVMDNVLINFSPIDSAYYRFGDLGFPLGFGDYTKTEIDEIISTIERKINNEAQHQL